MADKMTLKVTINIPTDVLEMPISNCIEDTRTLNATLRAMASLNIYEPTVEQVADNFRYVADFKGMGKKSAQRLAQFFTDFAFVDKSEEQICEFFCNIAADNKEILA